MIDAGLEHLRGGRVVAAATESLFGLLADATRSSALDALLRLKPRGAEKGIPLLLPSREAWSMVVVEIPPIARRLADAFWPGPLTIALPGRAGMDERILLEGRVAVRLPGPSMAAELAARLGHPLTATSANPPGMSPAMSDAEVRAAFPEASPELLVLRGRAPGGPPSTVVIVEQDSVRVVRMGAVPEAEILAAAWG